jgi:long-chain acyl-CoA synthetase
MFPERWLPSAIGLLGEPFTEQNRMLNSTMKLVRSKVIEVYGDLIEYLYTREGKDPRNRMVISGL